MNLAVAKPRLPAPTERVRAVLGAMLGVRACLGRVIRS